MGHRMGRRELMLLLGGAMTAAGASHAQQTAMSAVGDLHPTSPHEQNAGADRLNRFGNSTNRSRYSPWPETASTKRKGWPLPEPGIRAA
jgi:hypothetical protein